MVKKITRDMKINDVLEKNPEAAQTLFEAGLSCIGCPLSMHETIEQGFSAHGMDDDDIDEIIKELNK